MSVCAYKDVKSNRDYVGEGKSEGWGRVGGTRRYRPQNGRLGKASLPSKKSIPSASPLNMDLLVSPVAVKDVYKAKHGSWMKAVDIPSLLVAPGRWL